MKTRWESPTRFYVAELYQDIFGDWVLVTAKSRARCNCENSGESNQHE